MKKLLRNKILFLALPLSLMAVATSCQIKQDYTPQFKTNKEITHNELMMQKILDDDTSLSEKQREVYVNEQNKIDNSLITELKAALILGNLLNTDVIENASGSKKTQVIQAHSKIKQTLSENWYWFLNHLTNARFMLNPYGDSYDDQDETENNPATIKYFDYANEHLKNYILLLDNPKIQDFKVTKLNNLSADIHTDKKMIYIKLNDRYCLMLVRFDQPDKASTYLLLPDVFDFKNLNMSFENFVEMMQGKIEEIRLSQINKEIDYFSSSFREEGVSEEEHKRQISERIYKQQNDEKLFSLHQQKNYNEVFKLIMDDINKKEIKLLRYTWGYIYD
ncbi:hypothetical protein H9M94_00945 [Mycoplasma sp. Pen4]|uniref:aromatic motif membrane protein n=1 Tax=Mycoplasma sp. Pen4 TaxID=640330 RepID=UPI001654AB9C|nr:aromatic motif membrane protein [Mycoplasma sp. Pen4]QNM93827.1 hypothetical protein H9M94_00945 [Mycoplasma sp. Pen4]